MAWSKRFESFVKLMSKNFHLRITKILPKTLVLIDSHTLTFMLTIAHEYSLMENGSKSMYPTEQTACFQAWLDEHFKKTERDQLMLFTAENVLTPAALRQVTKHVFLVS